MSGGHFEKSIKNTFRMAGLLGAFFLWLMELNGLQKCNNRSACNFVRVGLLIDWTNILFCCNVLWAFLISSQSHHIYSRYCLHKIYAYMYSPGYPWYFLGRPIWCTYGRCRSRCGAHWYWLTGPHHTCLQRFKHYDVIIVEWLVHCVH